MSVARRADDARIGLEDEDGAGPRDELVDRGREAFVDDDPDAAAVLRDVRADRAGGHEATEDERADVLSEGGGGLVGVGLVGELDVGGAHDARRAAEQRHRQGEHEQPTHPGERAHHRGGRRFAFARELTARDSVGAEATSARG